MTSPLVVVLEEVVADVVVIVLSVIDEVTGRSPSSEAAAPTQGQSRSPSAAIHTGLLAGSSTGSCDLWNYQINVNLRS